MGKHVKSAFITGERLKSVFLRSKESKVSGLMPQSFTLECISVKVMRKAFICASFAPVT